MPSVVHKDMEKAFQNDLSDVPESLRPRIEQYVVGLQPRLMSTFEATKMEGVEQPVAQRASEIERSQEGTSLPEALQPGGSTAGLDFTFNLDDEPLWGMFQDDSAFINDFDPLVDPEFFQLEPDFLVQEKEKSS